MNDELIPEELTEEFFTGYGGNEDDEPPITTETQLERLDFDAWRNEVDRMLSIPAMVEVEPGEVEEQNAYVISTKFVFTWKDRFRRARLVARQSKSSVDIEQIFAPTRMLGGASLHCLSGFCSRTPGGAFRPIHGLAYEVIPCLRYLDALW